MPNEQGFSSLAGFDGYYGRGFDDVMIDADGIFWIVEYKGGGARLSPGQMEEAWVRQTIENWIDKGYELEFQHMIDLGTELRTALNSGNLRGVLVSTPYQFPGIEFVDESVAKELVRDWHYPPTQ